MPYTAKIIHDGTGVHLVGEGCLTGSEMIERGKMVSEMVPDLSKISHFVIDYSTVTDFDVSVVEMQTIAANGWRVVDKIGHKMYSAVVAPKPLEYGMVRMYSSLNNHPHLVIQIFKSITEAENWILKMLSLDSRI